MINFSDGIERPNKFGGSEKKTTILLDGEIYMIKLPDPIRNVKIKEVMSYKNNQYSEHIGCLIFNACGINAQETIMGYFNTPKGKRKIVTGCKDFTQNGEILYEMKKLANQIDIDGESRQTTTIENIMLIIDEIKEIKNKNDIKDKFWDMFVIDALIGNKDRHLDNWGIIEKNNEMMFAPVYDCGSALSALLDEDTMEKLLSEPGSFRVEEYNVASIYRIGGERIYYHEIFRKPPKELADAVRRVVPKIDMTEIEIIIDSIELMSNIRKDYLKKALSLRYEQVLIPAYSKIIEKTEK